MKKKKVIILGAGKVGRAIAEDLRKDADVTAADSDSARLKELSGRYKIKTVICDLSVAKTIGSLVKEYDLVIGAVPGYMGFKVLKNVIKEGKNVVDISFFPEDPFELDIPAKNKNITAIIDCGLAPGMSNIILGYHNSRMKVKNFECLVGGLPVKRLKPFEYKAPFSPADVIEEYTRPARTVVKGKIKIKPALSEIETVNFSLTGTLEAFNTDGLRTLLKTMRIPNMKEKTLRYPGHADIMGIFKECGFFEKKKIDINGVQVSPLELTSKLLFPFWKFDNEEHDFTVMQVKVEGMEDGVSKQFVYSLYDKYDEAKNISSMARTTGYTCSAVARLVLNGHYVKKGISPPEYIGAEDKCFSRILNELKSRNVIYELKENIL